MVEGKTSHYPTISFRPVLPSDRDDLEKIHANLFPIRYESEFFQNVVDGRDNIVAWAAIDSTRTDVQRDEIVGFVTARVVLAHESEIADLVTSSKKDQRLVYILTLGVVEAYRNLGIATALINEVINYASSIPTCRAVYLHVISYNNSAIHLYQKMSFTCVRKLYDFYFINGQHFDSFLFVYYVNGAQSPCSPLEFVTYMVAFVRNTFKSVATKLRKNEEKIIKWPKCKESRRLVTIHQNKKAEEGGYDSV